MCCGMNAKSQLNLNPYSWLWFNIDTVKEEKRIFSSFLFCFVTADFEPEMISVLLAFYLLEAICQARKYNVSKC